MAHFAASARDCVRGTASKHGPSSWDCKTAKLASLGSADSSALLLLVASESASTLSASLREFGGGVTGTVVEDISATRRTSFVVTRSLQAPTGSCTAASRPEWRCGSSHVNQVSLSCRHTVSRASLSAANVGKYGDVTWAASRWRHDVDSSTSTM